MITRFNKRTVSQNLEHGDLAINNMVSDSKKPFLSFKTISEDFIENEIPNTFSLNQDEYLRLDEYGDFNIRNIKIKDSYDNYGGEKQCLILENIVDDLPNYKWIDYNVSMTNFPDVTETIGGFTINDKIEDGTTVQQMFEKLLVKFKISLIRPNTESVEICTDTTNKQFTLNISISDTTKIDFSKGVDLLYDNQVIKHFNESELSISPKQVIAKTAVVLTQSFNFTIPTSKTFQVRLYNTSNSLVTSSSVINWRYKDTYILNTNKDSDIATIFNSGVSDFIVSTTSHDRLINRTTTSDDKLFLFYLFPKTLLSTNGDNNDIKYFNGTNAIIGLNNSNKTFIKTIGSNNIEYSVFISSEPVVLNNNSKIMVKINK